MDATYLKSSMSNIVKIECMNLNEIEALKDLPGGARGDLEKQDFIDRLEDAKSKLTGKDKISAKYKAYLAELIKFVKETKTDG